MCDPILAAYVRMLRILHYRWHFIRGDKKVPQQSMRLGKYVVSCSHPTFFFFFGEVIGDIGHATNILKKSQYGYMYNSLLTIGVGVGACTYSII